VQKPLLLLCPAFPKSGTTSLAWTLYTENLFFHFGHDKEPQYLHHLYCQNNNQCSNLNKFLSIKDYDIIYTQKNNSLNVSNYFTENLSIEKYCEYYLELWNNIKDTAFYGVSDFSQLYLNLPEDFLIETIKYLSQYFTVKCIVIARDPINRLFSYSNMIWNNGETDCSSAKEFFHQCLDDSYYQNLYHDVREKYRKLFEREFMITIPMEELFDPNYEDTRKKLEEFLNVPKIYIDYQNKNLAQTYTSILNEEDIQIAKDKLRRTYLYWFKKFGRIPKGWYYENLNKLRPF
jgi:hypothetical protein